MNRIKDYIVVEGDGREKSALGFFGCRVTNVKESSQNLLEIDIISWSAAVAESIDFAAESLRDFVQNLNGHVVRLCIQS